MTAEHRRLVAGWVVLVLAFIGLAVGGFLLAALAAGHLHTHDAGLKIGLGMGGLFIIALVAGIMNSRVYARRRRGDLNSRQD